MATSILSYTFVPSLDIENLSTAEADAALYQFLKQNLPNAKLINVSENSQPENLPENLPKNFKSRDKTDQQTGIAIIADIDAEMLQNYMANADVITDFLLQDISPENLICRKHYKVGNEGYYIAEVIHLDEDHI